MGYTPEDSGNNKALIDAIQELHHVDVRQIEMVRDNGVIDAASVAILPKGMDIKSLRPILEEFRQKPREIRAAVKITDTESMISYVNLFKDDRSIGFANLDNLTVSAIMDYHRPDDPENCAHHAIYTCPVSNEWQTWTRAMAAKFMDQATFAEFLEENACDMISAEGVEPATIMEVATQLRVSVKSNFDSGVNINTGEVQFTYTTEHKQQSKRGDITVPTKFFIAIPVFRDGDRYRLAVRLRYRLGDGGGVAWAISIDHIDRIRDNAFKEVVKAINEGTGLTIWSGSTRA